MAKKAVQWTKIKAEYLDGITPKDIAVKYGLTAKQVSDKAHKEGWVKEKTEIVENVRKNIQDQISRITNKALKRLENVLDNEDIKVNDLVSAIGKALDISGLKAETLNVAESSLTISVVKKD